MLRIRKFIKIPSKWPAVGIALVMALAMVLGPAIPASAGGYDLLTQGSWVGPINGAYFESFTPKLATGTGNYDSFLRIQKNNSEKGYNTDVSKPEFDAKSGIWTHSIQLGDIPVVVNPVLGAFDSVPGTVIPGVFYELRCDTNESGKGTDVYLTLRRLEIWMADAPGGATITGYVDDNAAPGYPPSTGFSGATRVWSLDTGVNNWVNMNYDLNSGSGGQDNLYLVPVSLFSAWDDTDYFILFAEFGKEVGYESVTYGTSAGFEEWGVVYPPCADLSIDKTATPGPVCPGAPITYTLVVTNNGPEAADNAKVGDILPAGVTVTSVEVDGTPTTDYSLVAGVLTYPATGGFALAVDASITLEIFATAPTDACDDTLVNSATVYAITPPDCDLTNNTDTASTLVQDTTDPVLDNLPPGGDLGCNPTPPACDPGVTASDNCDGDISEDVVCTPGPITGECNKSQTFNYYVEDECGNSDSANVTYTWKDDTTDPELGNLPGGGDLGCNPTPPACDPGVTASDNCDGDISEDVICTPGPITGECNKSQTFNYYVEDECGNSDSANVTYTWKVDLAPPVLPTLPAGGDLGCNPTPPSCVNGLNATDNCDGQVAVTCTAGGVTGTACNKSQIFTYYAVDSCSNNVSANVTYTWKVDLTAPVLPTLPAGGDLGCNPTPPSCVNGLNATDNCDGQVAVTCTAGGVTGTACNKSQIFTYYAVDSCSNNVSANVTYTWKVDLTPPVLPTLPAGGDLGCNPTPPSCVNGLNATDNCDGQVAVTCTAGGVTGTACNKSQIFTYYAVDSCSNNVSANVTYTWKVDLTAPVLPTLPAGGDLGCNPTPPSCVNGLNATDNCDGQVAVTCTAGGVTGTACNKSQIFTYYAVDSCSNNVSANVTYTWKVDLTAPVLPTLPAGGDLGCNPTPPSCVNGLNATDNCDGQVAVTCTAGGVTGTACNKSQIFTYYAVDSCSNNVSANVTYTWKVDLTAPVLPTLPAGGDLGCNPTPPSCVNGLNATDNCDGQVAVTCTAGGVTGTACNKSQIFTYYAVDSCSNNVSANVTYTWKVDLTPPVLPTLPAGGDLGCNPTPPSCVNGLNATDNCDGQVAVTCTAGGVTGTACNKSQIFTYYAVDSCSNNVSANVTYTWKVDLTPPVLPTLPAGGDLGCNPTPPSCVNGLNATDNCDGQVAVTCTAGGVTGTACNKSQIFTYYAVDSCSNNVSANVTYTWKVDLTAPVLPTLPAGGDLGCNPTPPSCVNGLNATDNCDGQVAVTCTAGGVTGTACNKSQIFTYYAVDSCSNNVSANVTYTWKVDLTPPVLPTLPAGGDLGCNPTPPSCVNGLNATDNCDGQVAVTCTAGGVTGTACNKSQIFTYYAVDSCSNNVSANVTYTWKVDLTPPVLPTLPAGGDLGCNPTPPSCVNGLNATDNCDGQVAVTCTAGGVTGTACNKSQIFTYYAVDSCSNNVSANVTYTWKVDLTPPVLPTLPAGGDLGCNPTPPSCVNGLNATDNCDGQVAVTCTAGGVTGTACNKSQIFTYYAVDSCSNNVSANVTYTWKVDLTAPELSGVPEDENLGCNPVVPTCASFNVTANDLCDGALAVNCTAGDVVNLGDCWFSQNFTFTAEDICGNPVEDSVTYTWKVDLTAPELSGVPEDENLGCNPVVPTCGSFNVTANDLCDGALAVNCTAGDVVNLGDCWFSQNFTFTAEDICGNPVEDSVTYTWKVDLTAPELSGVPEDENLGCNPVVPTCGSFNVTANDLCDGALNVTCTPGGVVNLSECRWSQNFTFYAEDICGNNVSDSVTYTWREDTTDPVLYNVPAGADLGCSEPPSCSPNVTANDNCDGALAVICAAGNVTGETCNWTQTFTYYAEDSCGNNASANVTYTWKEPECCVSCETACAANGTAGQIRFPGASSWFTYIIYNKGSGSNSTPVTYPIFAGQTQLVGTLYVYDNGTHVFVQYCADAGLGVGITSYHLEVVDEFVDFNDIRTKHRGVYKNPIPGKCEYKDSDSGMPACSDWIESVNDNINNYSDDVIYIFAHSIMCWSQD